MSIANVQHVTTTVTMFETPHHPVIDVAHGDRNRRVAVRRVTVKQQHGRRRRDVAVFGDFLRADGTPGVARQHWLLNVPEEIAALADEACAGVAL